MAADQGVLAGAGAMHPVQLAVDPQPGLVEADHLAAGDFVAHPIHELAQPAGGPGGDASDRARRQRRAEQLGQRLRGPFLGQELPHVQVHDDRGESGAVLHRGLHPVRGAAPDPLPAHPFPFHQPVFGHLHPQRRQVEQLAPLDLGDRPAGQRTPAARTAARLVHHLMVGVGHLHQRRAVMA